MLQKGENVTKLSFIKLDIEIMNDSKIKMIRKMPDGSKLFELWIGLLCLGMKSGRTGCIEIGDGIPFTPRMLSAELDISETTIELGLKTFSELRMIEFFDDTTIFLSNFEKHQELEKIEIKRINERERKQKYRDKLKELSRGTGLGQDEDGTECPELDKDRDINKNKEEDKNKEDFDLFWEAYNKKENKKKCIDKYKLLYKKKQLPEIQKHIEIIKSWHKTDKWKGGFQPNPLTWLNGERWEDELPTGKQKEENGKDIEQIKRDAMEIFG